MQLAPRCADLAGFPDAAVARTGDRHAPWHHARALGARLRGPAAAPFATIGTGQRTIALLPLYPQMTDDEQQQVIAALQSIARSTAGVATACTFASPLLGATGHCFLTPSTRWFPGQFFGSRSILRTKGCHSRLRASRTSPGAIIGSRAGHSGIFAINPWRSMSRIWSASGRSLNLHRFPGRKTAGRLHLTAATIRGRTCWAPETGT